MSVFWIQHPTGTFVHPSEGEKPLHECLDTLAKCYGDKKGQKFLVWLDKVTFAQISSDSWKVKFDKWESSGAACCVYFRVSNLAALLSIIRDHD